MAWVFRLTFKAKMTTFSAISPLNGGDLNDYYRDEDYPIDLNGALDFMRPAGVAKAFFPYPLMIGYVGALLPQFNALAFSEMYGKKPYGPWMSLPQGDFASAFPNIQGGLSKVVG